ncbi:hypothetical protein GE09DRAFT_1149771 [Coniochaeta sp. 2T2.1]|nr:hypothetical protein GE09DRAFT_1149771 [Coniochaeta sp. 2T2.1]
MAAPNIVIVGATGKQGRSVVDALLGDETPNSPLKLLCLTRDPSSPSAQALLESHPNAGIELVKGDLTEPEAIFSQWPKGHVSGVFLYTIPGKVDEDKQGIPFIDAAVAHGVKHIVFSSVDRGGDEKSWTNPTDVKHFYQKHNVEMHLRDKGLASHDTFTWTILRPVAFMDNWNPGFFASAFTAMLNSGLTPTKKLQVVSVRDIGVFASKALNEPERWAGRAVSLAGDEMTLAEAKERFRKVVGQELPQTWGILAKGMLWGVSELGAMFRFFEETGYGADIAALSGEECSLQDFETWLRESSGWKGEIEGKEEEK